MNFSDQEFGLNNIDRKKGHTQNWTGADHFKRFYSNKVLRPNNFSIKHYSENPIKYNFNNEFYRTPDDFNSESTGNMYLGCSHTFGTGLYLEDTWSYKLNSFVGGKFWNLGVEGSGFSTAYRVFMHYIEKLKVTNVFMYAPYPFRSEFYDKPKWKRLATNKKGLDANSALGKVVLNFHTAFITSTMVLKSIDYECEKRGIDFYFYNVEGNFIPGRDISHEVLSKNKQRCARDLIHFPTFYHDTLCETFLDMYKLKKVFKTQEKNINLFGETKEKFYI